MYRIALAGNPNCGKTSLFNVLSGSRYKVANYPGVTVEKKTAQIFLSNIEESVELFDLPGIYSLSSTSLDELIATKALLHSPTEKPDLIVCVVDAGNIERNLFLVTQLLDLHIPIVIALNMIDLAKQRGVIVYEQILSQMLDLPVVPVSAKKAIGMPALCDALSQALLSPKPSKKAFAWCKDPTIALQISAADENLAKPRMEISAYEATHRYLFCEEVANKTSIRRENGPERWDKKLDRLLTHRLFGSAIFIVLMAFIFQAIFTWSSIPMDFIESSVQNIGGGIGMLLPEGQVKSLIVDGVIAGVGSVLVFVPQIAILFFFLGLLEDSGYLSRAAFLMDGLMRKVGLQGRSFIPLLSSFACAIPGIMAARTIPSWADRLVTILVAPLMSCSARLPIYTVMIAAFIPSTKLFGIFSLQAFTLLSFYLAGIIGAAVIALLLKKTVLAGEPSFFIMELPTLRFPSLRLVVREVWDRIKLFCLSAGSVILACSVILWFLSSYPRMENASDSTVSTAPKLEQSYAGKLGTFIEPAIRPIGLNWEMGIGLIASFAAREVFVSALATIYNVGDTNGDDSQGSKSLLATLKEKKSSGEISFASALSLMVFYIFACQCMSTLAIVKKETGSNGWVAFLFIYSLMMAYGASFIIYRLLR